MQTTAKATRKELTQFVTIYQSILEFSLEKMWVEVIVKHNKKDSDDMLDEINAKLIEVCRSKTKQYNLQLDEYQLSKIVMDVYTQTISSIDEPFKVIAKESKTLVQEYLDKNKSKREALERIKKENEQLESEIEIAKREQVKSNLKLSAKNQSVYSNENLAKTDVSQNQGVQMESMGATPPPKKRAVRWTDALAINDFVLPSY